MRDRRSRRFPSRRTLNVFQHVVTVEKRASIVTACDRLVSACVIRYYEPHDHKARRRILNLDNVVGCIGRRLHTRPDP